MLIQESLPSLIFNNPKQLNKNLYIAYWGHYSEISETFHEPLAWLEGTTLVSNTHSVDMNL